MRAKFTRGTDHRLGIRFEPETFEEQLLLEQFARYSNDYEFKFSSWESNNPGRAVHEGLTSVWGELVLKNSPTAADSPRLSTAADENIERAKRYVDEFHASKISALLLASEVPNLLVEIDNQRIDITRLAQVLDAVRVERDTARAERDLARAQRDELLGR